MESTGVCEREGVGRHMKLKRFWRVTKMSFDGWGKSRYLFLMLTPSFFSVSQF
jgi:hypothetical protein